MTSGPPAMGLGMCKAAPDIMQHPPHDANRGIFTNGTHLLACWPDAQADLLIEVFLDMAVYGIVGGGIGIGAFTLVVHAFGGGDLGLDACNTSRAGCETVFRARATCFATVCMIALLLAWELVDLRRSCFAMTPGAKRPWTQWMRDTWANQVLFWVSDCRYCGIPILAVLTTCAVDCDRLRPYFPVDLYPGHQRCSVPTCAYLVGGTSLLQYFHSLFLY
jgi:Na+-exporting ATPase